MEGPALPIVETQPQILRIRRGDRLREHCLVEVRDVPLHPRAIGKAVTARVRRHNEHSWLLLLLLFNFILYTVFPLLGVKETMKKEMAAMRQQLDGEVGVGGHDGDAVQAVTRNLFWRRRGCAGQGQGKGVAQQALQSLLLVVQRQVSALDERQRQQALALLHLEALHQATQLLSHPHGAIGSTLNGVMPHDMRVLRDDVSESLQQRSQGRAAQEEVPVLAIHEVLLAEIRPSEDDFFVKDHELHVVDAQDLSPLGG
eukprot:scaffold3818_cov155-Ochromonas_danica.AAC.9